MSEIVRFPKKHRGDVAAPISQLRDLFLEPRTPAERSAAFDAAEALGRAAIDIHRALHRGMWGQCGSTPPKRGGDAA